LRSTAIAEGLFKPDASVTGAPPLSGTFITLPGTVFTVK